MTRTNKVVEDLVYKFIEIGLPLMASELERQYQKPSFMSTDPLTLIGNLLEPEYSDKVSKRLNNRLRAAHLINSPQRIDECQDSAEREYLPHGITDRLKDLDFIDKGMNVCILGASDSGKTYLAKALGIQSCDRYKVHYHHCGDLLEELAALKSHDYQKYSKKLKCLIRTDLLILDDFLLHTVSDEEEVKILFAMLEGRQEGQKSTIVCSQRDPKSWKSMIMNDEVSTNAVLKRVTKHYTIAINTKEQ